MDLFVHEETKGVTKTSVFQLDSFLKKNRHDSRTPAFMIIVSIISFWTNQRHSFFINNIEFIRYSGLYYNTMHIPDESGSSLI